MLIYPECAHEWSANESTATADAKAIRGALGDILQDSYEDHDTNCKIEPSEAMKLKS